MANPSGSTNPPRPPAGPMPDGPNPFGPDGPNVRDDEPPSPEAIPLASPPTPPGEPLDDGDFAPDEA